MTKVSNVYTAVDIEVVRGGVPNPPLTIRATDAAGIAKDMTGRTVTFRAIGGGHTIEKTISSFTDIDGVACGIVILLTEADTRGITYPMDWEIEDDEHVVFGGGKLIGAGGANRDA